MSNYHMEIRVIGRSREPSVTKLASYITGRDLHDSLTDQMCRKQRNDVLWHDVFHPRNVPGQFCDLQRLCDQIEAAEIRKDARTAREFICSLPNELPDSSKLEIVNDFVKENFVKHGLCAIVAIHEGRNIDDPSKNNPHVHIIVPTRTVDADGFSKKKDREHDKREWVGLWRERWAYIQNRTYEREGLSIRVSHKSLEDQGERDLEPTPHISRFDMERERRGERTFAGDQRRAVKQRNNERICRKQTERDRSVEREPSR